MAAAALLILQVLVLNQAEVPVDTLHRAQQETSRIFENAGISLEWISPGQPLARSLIVRIVPKPPRQKGWNATMLGIAPESKDVRQRLAWLFYDRNVNHGRALKLDTAQLLGNVMAHEMGHLMLPPGPHAVAGLMKGGWNLEQAVLASMSRLGLQPHEAAMIRAQVGRTSEFSMNPSPSWTDVVRASGQAKADLELIRETADKMAHRSSTFAGMLAILKSTTWLIVFARPAAIPGKLGQTQFYVESERTFGLMEINVNRLNPAARVRAIAHELAHVAEVACLARTRATSELLRDLRGHVKRHASPGDSTESAFPLAVEKAVLAEYRNEPALGGDITAIAQRHGLSACPTTLQESRSTSRELQNARRQQESQDVTHRRP